MRINQYSNVSIIRVVRAAQVFPPMACLVLNERMNAASASGEQLRTAQEER